MLTLRSTRRALFSVCMLFTTACGIVEPCDFGSDPGMRGVWDLVLVNGQPIPPSGTPIPGSTNRLASGSLVFSNPLKVTGCAGGSGATSEGTTVADYTMNTNIGRGTWEYGGSYSYDHSSGEVTLRAAGREAKGTRFGNEFTIAPNAPIVGSAVLTFRQTSDLVTQLAGQIAGNRSP